MSIVKHTLPYLKTLVTNQEYEPIINDFLNLSNDTGIYNFNECCSKQSKDMWTDFIFSLYGPSGPFHTFNKPEGQCSFNTIKTCVVNIWQKYYEIGCNKKKSNLILSNLERIGFNIYEKYIFQKDKALAEKTQQNIIIENHKRSIEAIEDSLNCRPKALKFINQEKTFISN